MEKSKSFVDIIILSVFCLFLTAISSPELQVSSSPFDSFMTSAIHRGCPESYKKFEIMSGYAFNSPSDAFASLPVRDITVTLVKRNQNFHSIFFDRFYAIFHTRRLLPSLPLIMGVFKQEKIMLLSSFFFDSQ